MSSYSRAYHGISASLFPLSSFVRGSERQNYPSRTMNVISQRRLGSAFLVYDVALVCWLVRCSVSAAQGSSGQRVASLSRLPYMVYIGLTFVQGGLMLLTASLFILANLSRLVVLVRNVYLVILIVRGLFLTPLLLFSFSDSKSNETTSIFITLYSPKGSA